MHGVKGRGLQFFQGWGSVQKVVKASGQGLGRRQDPEDDMYPAGLRRTTERRG